MSLRSLKGCCTATLSAAPSPLPRLLAHHAWESACIGCCNLYRLTSAEARQLLAVAHQMRPQIDFLPRLTVVRVQDQCAADPLTPLLHIGRCCCRGCVLPWRYENTSLAVELAQRAVPPSNLRCWSCSCWPCFTLVALGFVV